jgi:predicted RNase H-like HicB family nuclease
MDGDMETRRTLPQTRAQASRTAKAAAFNLKVEFDREIDGRWIADIPALPGVTVYGRTRKQAFTAVEVLALRVIADLAKRCHYESGAPQPNHH